MPGQSTWLMRTLNSEPFHVASCSFGAVAKLYLCAVAGAGLAGCVMKKFDIGILCLFLYTKEYTNLLFGFFLVETGIADL